MDNPLTPYAAWLYARLWSEASPEQRRLATTAPRVRYLVRTDPWTDGWSAKDWTRLASRDVHDTPKSLETSSCGKPESSKPIVSMMRHRVPVYEPPAVYVAIAWPRVSDLKPEAVSKTSRPQSV